MCHSDRSVQASGCGHGLLPPIGDIGICMWKAPRDKVCIEMYCHTYTGKRENQQCRGNLRSVWRHNEPFSSTSADRDLRY